MASPVPPLSDGSRSAAIPWLLFASGCCALIFQVAWLREFRLIFGSSTAATAAVLAIFMGGLGVGHAWFGPRVDRHAEPLATYGRLELGIALLAAISPWLIDLVRTVYVATGGSLALGLPLATLARIGAAVVVLGPPTILMGGTLPAAIRSATTADDTHRRSAALLYGLNTLGAVAGALTSTFLLLPNLGVRTTLFAAASVNLLVAVTALRLAELPRIECRPIRKPTPTRHVRRPAKEPRSIDGPDRIEPHSVSPRTIFLVAAIVGFVFFLMESVWYRMLGPILGGTTFTFGLILAVALGGIGLGGLLHALFSSRLTPTRGLLALTCAIEALAIGLPMAAGDRLAFLAAGYRATSRGFSDDVVGWAIVAGWTIGPAALVAGFQFPLLISLAGRGDREIGRHVGSAFAWNTGGAIIGSLAGGFGLLPLLSAIGAWRGGIMLTAATALGLALVALRYEPRRRLTVAASLLGIAAFGPVLASGPTAVWRHGGIGAGRADLATPDLATRTDLEHFIRGSVLSETDGIEASVAIVALEGLAFYLNGKSDGNAVGDAGTQIMLGMLPATLHPRVESSLVIGLGTGETAGWLAAIPTVRRVDVVELEPAVIEMAERCASVNRDVLKAENVRLIFDDAREVLLTTDATYDLIASEPSNPYRVGVANLFTREFYRASRARLRPGGLFVQWLQGYEVDLQTTADVLATLQEVFPHVEIWQSKAEDLLLVGSDSPIPHDADRVRERLGSEPFGDALRIAWRAADAEAFFARYVVGPSGTNPVDVGIVGRINSDDLNRIEYGFARTLGRGGSGPIDEIRRGSAAGDGAPRVASGSLDARRLAGHRQLVGSNQAGRAILPEHPTDEQQRRHRFLTSYWNAATDRMIADYEAAPHPVLFPDETAILALGYADLGREEAMIHLASLAKFQPSDAAAIEAYLRLRQGKGDEAADRLIDLFELLRDEPWGFTHATELIFTTLSSVCRERPSRIAELREALREPFAVRALDTQRREALWRLSALLGPEAMLEILPEFEPHVPWDETFLTARWDAYRASADADAAVRAGRDLERFLEEREASSERRR
ncbi:MAG TPA: fused MFS/spermidine synthase [Pirellulaceae bacterium]|nr:fused MFS/spermidine synthase [Pirellulaceae bacterium]